MRSTLGQDGSSFRTTLGGPTESTTTPIDDAVATVAVVDDPLFDSHASRGYHPERPERLAAARRGVAMAERAGCVVARIAAPSATEEQVRRAHGDDMVRTLRELRGRHAAIDSDTYSAPGSFDAALRAAGAAIAVVDRVCAATERHAMALVRPPGHHAERGRSMGFCLLNNVAIAAAHALHQGLDRVAIVDWDVHHGNGTQNVFWEDPRVLFVSLHQSPLYPGTGAVTERGGRKGLGTTVNVPLSPGATDATYVRAFEEVVLPALTRFRPELLLVSAGYDAHRRDPLASMSLTERGFAWMTRALRQVAEDCCGGRLGLVLEGGYDLLAVEQSVAATLFELAESGRTKLQEPGPDEPPPQAGAQVPTVSLSGDATQLADAISSVHAEEIRAARMACA